MIWLLLGAIVIVSAAAAGPMFVMVLGCRGACRQIDKEADRLAQGYPPRSLAVPDRRLRPWTPQMIEGVKTAQQERLERERRNAAASHDLD
jgi:hypothetical protein